MRFRDFRYEGEPASRAEHSKFSLDLARPGTWSIRDVKASNLEVDGQAHDTCRISISYLRPTDRVYLNVVMAQQSRAQFRQITKYNGRDGCLLERGEQQFNEFTMHVCRNGRYVRLPQSYSARIHLPLIHVASQVNVYIPVNMYIIFIVIKIIHYYNAGRTSLPRRSSRKSSLSSRPLRIRPLSFRDCCNRMSFDQHSFTSGYVARQCANFTRYFR